MAKKEGKGFILQGDLNAWLGSDLIPNDPHKQNKNGKMFETFLSENNLVCVNSLPLTKGLITRSRNVAGVIQKSVVDFYIVCELVLPFISQMKIDSDKKHLLTNYKPALLDLKVCDSDHMVLSMDLNLKGVFKKVNKI